MLKLNPKQEIVPPQFIVRGAIRDQEGKPRTGLTVKAFDRDFRREAPLGEAITDDQGNYSITYSSKQLGIRAAADMVIKIFQGDRLLQISDVIFNAGKIETRDFVVPETDTVFDRLFQRIKDLLRPRN